MKKEKILSGRAAFEADDRRENWAVAFFLIFVFGILFGLAYLAGKNQEAEKVSAGKEPIHNIQGTKPPLIKRVGELFTRASNDLFRIRSSSR